METTDRYKLVRVDVDSTSWVKPIDEHGREYGDPLMDFGGRDDDYYFAIYENIGTTDDPIWEEYDYFEQDFNMALQAYRDLQKPTKKYELTVLIRRDCDKDAERDKIYHKIKAYSGRVLNDEDGGLKALAYGINDEEYANYHYFSIRLVKGDATKLSNWLNLQNNVLRYLLVQDDKRKD